MAQLAAESAHRRKIGLDAANLLQISRRFVAIFTDLIFYENLSSGSPYSPQMNFPALLMASYCPSVFASCPMMVVAWIKIDLLSSD